MDIRVSIVISTLNRASSLRETIASISRCFIPRDLHAELIIVDNGSTDATSQVVLQANPINMPLRYLREEQPGKSRAYNRALTVAQGDILLFTDDDLRVPSDWIEGMCRPIAEGQADAVAGGVVFPPKLDRKARVFRSWLASTERINAENPERFVGANMAFSRRILQQIPGFDIELGPGALGFGEETLFSWQLREAGFRLISRFDITVEHHFEPSRLSRASMLKTARKMGRTEAYLSYHWKHEELNPTNRLVFLKNYELWRQRLLSPQTLISSTPTEWELRSVKAVCFWSQFQKLVGARRKYTKRGLLKIDVSGVTDPVVTIPIKIETDPKTLAA